MIPVTVQAAVKLRRRRQHTLIRSGRRNGTRIHNETSSYRSNPLGLAEFTLSRKDPQYVGRAKEIQKAEKERMAGGNPCSVLPQLKGVMDVVKSPASAHPYSQRSPQWNAHP